MNSHKNMKKYYAILSYRYLHLIYKYRDYCCSDSPKQMRSIENTTPE